MKLFGYALVLSDGTPFSWHETEPVSRQKYERDVFGRALLRVQASSVDWSLCDKQGD